MLRNSAGQRNVLYCRDSHIEYRDVKKVPVMYAREFARGAISLLYVDEKDKS